MIQLRFIHPNPERVGPVVGPFAALHVTANNIREHTATGLLVAAFDTQSHMWYVAPGYDPSPAPSTYDDFVIEVA
jgi:hypothetical protein